MTAPALPILPTTVVGSYAIPAWLWTAWEKIEAGGFGAIDRAETEDDAVETAIRDQERTGVDLISDGEMRRQGFIVSIFKYFRGLRQLEPRRKVGVLAWRLLESVKAERLWINPDCGLARLPRHLAFAKLQALIAGAGRVRRELTGAPSTPLPAQTGRSGAPSTSNRPPSVAPGSSSDK